MNPKVRGGLSVVDIDGEWVMYDQVEDGLHHLNAAAGMVLQLCDGTGSEEEIATDISDVGGLPLDEVLEQVRHVVHHFQQLGILEGFPAAGDEEGRPEESRDHHDHEHRDHPGDPQRAEESPKDPDQLETQDTQNH